ERRIDVLLPNRLQSAPVCPQRDGTCPTCSAWRYNSLTGLTCGCHNGATVFLAGTSRAGRHRSRKHASRQGTQEAQTRTLEMDQALPPPPPHRRRGLLIPRRTTGDSASSTVVMSCH
ncbi:mucin TcMUCII, partial [Trypanosoma cruzi]